MLLLQLYLNIHQWHQEYDIFQFSSLLGKWDAIVLIDMQFTSQIKKRI